MGIYALILKTRKAKVLSEKKGLSHKQEHNAEQNETEDGTLVRKIDSITKTCTKAYFNKILKNLAHENPENASILCDYIVAEEIEINIKNSTKEGRIKIITWLSNHYRNKKHFKQMTKQDWDRLSINQGYSWIQKIIWDCFCHFVLDSRPILIVLVPQG